MEPHVTNGTKHLFNMFKDARSLLKKPINRGDKICAMCLKAFNQTSHLKKHIEEVHDGIKTPWDLWLLGFFANNWFAHIGKLFSSTYILATRVPKTVLSVQQNSFYM